jgi:hypothetical protein
VSAHRRCLHSHRAANMQEQDADADVASSEHSSSFLEDCARCKSSPQHFLSVARRQTMSQEKPNPGIAGLLLFGSRIRKDTSSHSRDKLTNHVYSFRGNSKIRHCSIAMAQLERRPNPIQRRVLYRHQNYACHYHHSTVTLHLSLHDRSLLKILQRNEARPKLRDPQRRACCLDW